MDGISWRRRELPRAVAGNPNRHIVFQRFYIGPITGRNAQQRVGQSAHEARVSGFEGLSCATDGAFAKSTVDTQITTDLLTWAYCHSVDVLALCSVDEVGPKQTPIW